MKELITLEDFEELENKETTKFIAGKYDPAFKQEKYKLRKMACRFAGSKKTKIVKIRGD